LADQLKGEAIMNQLAIKPAQSESVTSTKSSLSATVDIFSAMVAAMENSRRRHQARMQFAATDPRILRDAGISEAQLFLEVNKPFE
jgi:uncharacterized protein YjiS (DUF1127 family)